MKKKIALIISLVIFVALCFVFNKYDLDISIYLTKYHNGFSKFFAVYGECPIYIGPILFGATLYYLTKKLWQKYTCAGINYIAYLIASIKVIHNKGLHLDLNNIMLAICVAILLTLITFMIFSKIKRENLNKFKDLAFLWFVVSLVSVSITEVLKCLWGRVRFRDLSSDYSEFTKLFHVNGYNGNKSFPSGHTSAGTTILVLALIIPRFTDKKWVKYLVTVLCFTYILCLQVARIMASAHYASDVLCGFVVSFTTLCVTYKIMKRKGIIDVAGNKC